MCKDVQKANGGTNKHVKHNIARSGKREGYTQSDPTSRDVSQVVTPKQGLVGVECNHTNKNPLRASNVEKPRTKEANISIKHRNKQA